VTVIDTGRYVLLRHGLEPHGWGVLLGEDGQAVSLVPLDERWRITYPPELVCEPLRAGGRSWWQWETPGPDDIAGVVRTPITPGNEVGKAVRLVLSTLRKHCRAVE
jgi:hypothetical protein